MADDLDALEPTLGVDVTPLPPVQPRGGGRFRGRFLVAYGVLALALAGAAIGLVVLVGKPGAAPETGWSAWHPDGDPQDRAQQIASHIGAQYRLSSGEQLVGVQATPPRVQDIPIGAIATRRPPELGSTDPVIDIFPSEDSLVFILCGLGVNCAIQQGQPSSERLRLLRRESLELALYTFRYIDDTNSVVVFLPPAPGEDPSYALLFRRGELEAQLDQPLRATLPDATPPLPEHISPTETTAIERLTAPSLFRFEFQRLQDGTAVLVLNDPSLQPPDQADEQQQPSDEAAQ